MQSLTPILLIVIAQYTLSLCATKPYPLSFSLYTATRFLSLAFFSLWADAR